jgi:hypothetical protein
VVAAVTDLLRLLELLQVERAFLASRPAPDSARMADLIVVHTRIVNLLDKAYNDLLS